MTASIAPRVLGTDPASSGPIPFTRLVGVEWTKATDTRSARWLLGIVALSTVGVMAAPIVVPERFDQTYAGYLEVATIAPVILLPVVAMLMLTGEWSQRNIMTTFTQEPRRLRIVAAKVSAALLLGAIAAVFGGVVAAAGIGIAEASGRTFAGALGVGDIAGYVLYLLLNVLGGVAVGALVQNSAMAIASYFALNMSVALIGTFSTPVANWIDTATTWPWVIRNDWDGHVSQILVSILIWVVVPLTAGAARHVRRDIG